MSDLLKHHKYVTSLPEALEKNAIYYVKNNSGFDMYVTNNTGEVVAYPMNIPELPTLHEIAESGSYNDLNDVPASFPPSAHDNTAHSETYATTNQLFSGSYTDLTNVPSTFTPSSHNNTAHSETYITSSALTGYATETYVDNNVFSGSYGDLSNVPSTFTPSTHNNTAHSDNYYKSGDSVSLGTAALLSNATIMTLNTTGNPSITTHMGGSTNTGTYRNYAWGSSRTYTMECMGDIAMVIDYNNNQTSKHFSVRHNGEGTAGTLLFRVREDGIVQVSKSNYGMGVRESRISSTGPSGGKNGDVWLRY